MRLYPLHDPAGRGAFCSAFLRSDEFNSIQGGSKDGSSESADAAAAEILQWFTAVDNAVLRMRLNGIAYEDMSFTYDARYQSGSLQSGYANNTRCTLDNCRIFASSGGGVSPPNVSKYSNPAPTGVNGTSLGSGYIAVHLVQWPGAGSSANDVVFRLSYLTESVCSSLAQKINQTSRSLLSGSAVSAVDPSNWNATAQTFVGELQFIEGNDSHVEASIGSGTSGGILSCPSCRN